MKTSAEHPGRRPFSDTSRHRLWKGRFAATAVRSLLAILEAEPDVLYLALGTTDGDPKCRPALHIFVGSKAAWHEITDDLPQHESRTYDTDSGQQPEAANEKIRARHRDLTVVVAAVDRHKWTMTLNNEAQTKPVIDDVEAFLQDQRPKLLRYLDGKAPKSPDDPGPLDQIERVLDEWSERFIGRDLRAPCLRQRTFRVALYRLEELVEHAVRGKLDPYEAVLLQCLAEVAEILRHWQELPEQYYATRPGEM